MYRKSQHDNEDNRPIARADDRTYVASNADVRDNGHGKGNGKGKHKGND
jgi:hypothetical protein